jgi:hypothetical protein
VRLQPRPRVVANGLHLFGLDELEEVFTWAAEIGPSVPRAMEMMLFIHRDDQGEPEIAVTGPVLMDSEEEARAALALLETCPAAPRAKAALPYAPAQMADLYAAAGLSYPDDHRYAVDNMWTHAPVAELLPGLRRIGEEVPAAPSHMLWMNWGASPERQEMAYSVEDETYIALYAVWSDAAGDAANIAWAEDNMRAMEHLASGIQLADENLGRRPARFLSDANYERIDRVRAQYDPDGLFHTWMGRP